MEKFEVSIIVNGKKAKLPFLPRAEMAYLNAGDFITFKEEQRSFVCDRKELYVGSLRIYQFYLTELPFINAHPEA